MRGRLLTSDYGDTESPSLTNRTMSAIRRKFAGCDWVYLIHYNIWLQTGRELASSRQGRVQDFSFTNSSRQVFGSIRHLIQLEYETSSHGLKQQDRELDYSCPCRAFVKCKIVTEASPLCHIFIFLA